MPAWEIVLIVIGLILAVYLLIVITDIAFVVTFKTLLTKHKNALNVFLQTKYDSLLELYKVMQKYDPTTNPRYANDFEELDISHLHKPHTKEGEKVRLKLSYLRDELICAANKSKVLEKNEEFLRVKQHIIDLDKVYYAQIATYNADIIGYNYWIRFVPTRYIYTLLKIKTIDIIS